MPRQFFHYLCVLLLLVAQQGALVHATWHAKHDTHADQVLHRDAHQEPPANRDSQGNLCTFDLAFGQVLGGAHGSCAPQLVVVLPASPTAYSLNPRASAEAVPALSRGPPVLL